MSDLELTAEASPRCIKGTALVLCATESGKWRAAEELLAEALAAREQGCDLSVDVAGADYLNAATLQIFMALQISQKQKDMALDFLNVSPALMSVLRCVGAARPLGMEGDLYA